MALQQKAAEVSVYLHAAVLYQFLSQGAWEWFDVK